MGGKNLLPMKDLQLLFTGAGCASVRTFIQSGNVLFKAQSAVLNGLEERITKQIHERFGLRVPVIVRNQKELEDEYTNNPFVRATVNSKELHILFLQDGPSEPAVRSLDPDRSPPDAFAVRGRAVYLKLPNGAGRTKLTNQYFDAKLSTVSTGRNWNTVGKLLDLLRDL